MRASLLAYVVAVVGALTACSSTGGGDTVDATPEALPSVCVTDPRVQPFTVGLETTTASGLHVKILDAQPAPPAKGDNTWTLAVSDPSGAPVDGATLTVKPFMPDHGHGSSIVPAIAPLGDGKYSLTRLNLFMPGVWEITVSVAQDAAHEDAVFTLCIST